MTLRCTPTAEQSDIFPAKRTIDRAENLAKSMQTLSNIHLLGEVLNFDGNFHVVITNCLLHNLPTGLATPDVQNTQQQVFGF